MRHKFIGSKAIWASFVFLGSGRSTSFVFGHLLFTNDFLATTQISEIKTFAYISFIPMGHTAPFKTIVLSWYVLDFITI